MKRKILWGAMASFISFMIIAIALMTAMFIRMVQMTVPESSSVSPSRRGHITMAYILISYRKRIIRTIWTMETAQWTATL